jgi:hypothetical protein
VNSNKEDLMKYDCDKPAIVFYRERIDKPEREAFAVIKARRLTLTGAAQGAGYDGIIKDFFPLMGSLDPIRSDTGRNDRYVLCWTDDAEEDQDKSWKRLTGVVFPEDIELSVNARGKKTYNTSFQADRGKIE